MLLLQAKSLARKGVNQILGMHAPLVPALGIEVLGGKGTLGTYANYTTLYLIILCGKNTWIVSISSEKIRTYRKYINLHLPHVCIRQNKAKTTSPCTSSWSANTKSGSSLQRWWPNCSTVTHRLQKLPSSFPHCHEEWAIFNAEHLNVGFSTASQRLGTYARTKQWQWVVA